MLKKTEEKMEKPQVLYPGVVLTNTQEQQSCFFITENCLFATQNHGLQKKKNDRCVGVLAS